MKGILIENGYVMNFNKRCIHCGACEVAEIDVGKSNLMENQFGSIMCKDEVQCHVNRKNELALIEVGISDDDVTLTDRYGNEVIIAKWSNDYDRP